MHLLTLNPVEQDCPSVVTIGNFDGLHLGHRQLIQAVQREAERLKAASAVVIFEPLPLEFFAPEKAPPRLMSLKEKLLVLREWGVQRVYLAHFNGSFSQLTAESFVAHILVEQLKAKAVWVGDDFRFGYRREGDFALLQRLSMHYDFQVAQAPTFLLHGRRLASTWLRETLVANNLALAKEILGRPYGVLGRVLHGQKLGRTIGFPTLNLLFKYPPALNGVFIVQVHQLADQPLWGIANVGKRPTVSGQEHRLEVHVFDWQGNAYGRYLMVEFVHFLRAECQFPSLTALRTQIQQDRQVALDWIVHQVLSNELV